MNINSNSQYYKHLKENESKMLKELSEIKFDKSDVFGMGMILYQMKNQKTPIKTEEDEALPAFTKWMINANNRKIYTPGLAYQQIQLWNSMNSFKPNDPEDKVIYKMLSLNPNDRPTAREALEALKEVYSSNKT
jgi:serine/threonine protein kinase